MYQFDLSSQRDQIRLSLEAEALGRQAARTMPLAERSDVIRARAQQLCERALSNSVQLTNDADKYITFFVDAYTDAYFMEIVAFFHANLPLPSQTQPESQSIPP